MPSFIGVTGPKTNLWLVRMVGALATAIGLVLLRHGLARDAGRARLLALLAALAFMAVDAVHALPGIIGPVYLGDAFVQLLFIAGWALPWLLRHGGR